MFPSPVINWNVPTVPGISHFSRTAVAVMGEIGSRASSIITGTSVTEPYVSGTGSRIGAQSRHRISPSSRRGTNWTRGVINKGLPALALIRLKIFSSSYNGIGKRTRMSESAFLREQFVNPFTEVQEIAFLAYGCSEFYREKLHQTKLKPEEIRSIADLSRLPLTTR